MIIIDRLIWVAVFIPLGQRWQLDTVQRQKSPNKWHKSAHAGELDQPLQVLSKFIHLMTVDIDMYSIQRGVSVIA